MLNLEAQQAIANGSQKIVFDHPESSNLLIKVINPDFINVLHQKFPRYTQFRRLRYYWYVINELIEHVYSRENNLPNNYFLQNFRGLVDTNLGLGMVVEAVRRDNGSLAETLKEIIEDGRYTEEHAQALEDIIHWINTSYIIIRDLAVQNLVWNEKGKHFVIIDGIGAKELPSLRSISKKYNTRANINRTNKLRARIIKKLSTTKVDNNDNNKLSGTS